MADTYYDVLNIPRSASADEVRKAYHNLARKWHPDKNPVSREEADRIFKVVSKAYEVLSDPSQRAAYDQVTFGPSPYQWSARPPYRPFTTSSSIPPPRSPHSTSVPPFSAKQSSPVAASTTADDMVKNFYGTSSPFTAGATMEEGASSTNTREDSVAQQGEGPQLDSVAWNTIVQLSAVGLLVTIGLVLQLTACVVYDEWWPLLTCAVFAFLISTLYFLLVADLIDIYFSDRFLSKSGWILLGIFTTVTILFPIIFLASGLSSVDSFLLQLSAAPSLVSGGLGLYKVLHDEDWWPSNCFRWEEKAHGGLY